MSKFVRVDDCLINVDAIAYIKISHTHGGDRFLEIRLLSTVNGYSEKLHAKESSCQELLALVHGKEFK